MLTLFSIPKAFDGQFGVIQWNALRSWIALGGGIQVVLVGDEPGVAEAAREVGAAHVAGVARSERGTPRIDDAFAKADALAEHPLRCFVNADVLLLDDLLPAAGAVCAVFDRFLVVGASRDLDLTEELRLDVDGRAELRRRALAEGRSRGATAIDYFVFTAGLFDPIPPFVVGRARFDNWLVWRARERGPVVDATQAVTPVHQRHDYAHIAGGFEEAHFGIEALRNEELAGGSHRIYTIFDASHRLRADGVVCRHFGSSFRARETVRKAAWKLGQRWPAGRRASPAFPSQPPSPAGVEATENSTDAVPLVTRMKRRATGMTVFRPLVNILIVSRYGTSIRWLLTRPRFLFSNRELSNFTYDLDNETELVHFVSDTLQRSLEEIAAYAGELTSDQELVDAIVAEDERHSVRPRFARRLGWYCIVRAMRPRFVVETGTHDGLGTSVLARAVERNGDEGFPGTVMTFDTNENAGRLVPRRLRHLVEFHTGDSRATLDEALSGREIGCFLHDSLHTYEHERFELETALRHAASAFVLISDNAHASSALSDVCQNIGATYSFFREQPKNHFYPGAGIGVCIAADHAEAKDARLAGR